MSDATNLDKILIYLNEYAGENNMCPTYVEFEKGTGINRGKIERLLRALYVVGLISPIRVKNASRIERNWKLSHSGEKYLLKVHKIKPNELLSPTEKKNKLIQKKLDVFLKYRDKKLKELNNKENLTKNEKVLRYYLENHDKPLNKTSEKFGFTRSRLNQIIRLFGVPKKHRVLTKTSGNEAEKHVLKIIKERGVDAFLMPHTAEYDIETKSGKKIEVKHRRCLNKNYNNSSVRVAVYNKDKIDFLIVVIGELDNPTYYILKKREIKSHLSFPVKPVVNTKKQRNMKNNWSRIK